MKKKIARLVVIVWCITGAVKSNATEDVKVISVNGLKLWTRTFAEEMGPKPIFYLHGGPGGHSFVFENTFAPRLGKHHPLIIFDQRGSGRSEKPESSDYSMSTLVSDIEALRRELNLKRIILYGASFGTELALEYTLKYPKFVDRIILESPTAGNYGWIMQHQINEFLRLAKGSERETIEKISKRPASLQQRYFEVWDSASPSLVDRFLFVDPKSARKVRSHWAKSKFRSNQEFAKQIFLEREKVSMEDPLRSVGVPALIIIGRHDHNVGLESARKLSGMLRLSSMVVMEKSGHFPHVEEPDEVLASIKSFLK